MNLRAFFFGLLSCALAIAGSAACDGASSSDDCSSARATCGACEEGFINSTRCVDGEWECGCLPGDDARASTPSSEDAGGDAALPEKLPVFTCQQALASPTTRAYCSADDWDVSCDQGCLTCRCSGTWGCTTSPACFDSGGG